MVLRSVILLLGSNLGDKKQNLAIAIKHIENQVGDIVVCSSLYETEPWGKESDNCYLNQAIEVRTPLTPEKLLEALQAIELSIGRIRAEKWGDRTIDIDIIFYGHEVVDLPHLQIPHKHMQHRNFVLVPLAEIAPTRLHPVLGKSIKELVEISEDKGLVSKHI